MIEALGLEVRMCDVRDEGHRAALVQARGRATVPVLRIHREGTDDKWMPESVDIIRYLEGEAGEGAPAPGWIDRLTMVSGPLALSLVATSLFVEAPASNWIAGTGIALFLAAALRRAMAMRV